MISRRTQIAVIAIRNLRRNVNAEPAARIACADGADAVFVAHRCRARNARSVHAMIADRTCIPVRAGVAVLHGGVRTP